MIDGHLQAGRLRLRRAADGLVGWRGRGASPAGRARLLLLAALVVFFGLLTALRFAMTAGAFRNSDDASNFLAGVEMAEGNWQLHGWVLAADNYYPTDVLGEALLKLLLGYHPILMQGLEALIWAAIAMLGAALACVGSRLRHRPGIIALALALLAFNVFEHDFRDVFVSSVASHGFTILLTLVAFALFAGAEARAAGGPPRLALWRAASLSGVVTIGSFADPIFNIIACLPMLVVSLLGLSGRGSARRPVTLLGVTVGGVILARLLLALNGATGGFESVHLSITLASFQQLLDHLGFAVESIARLLGAEFFGRSIDHRIVGGPGIYLLRAPLLLGFAVVCWEVGRDVLRRIGEWPARHHAPPAEDLDHLLWTSLFLCVVSTCMTTVIIDQSCARFFYPATVTGAILVARRFGRLPLTALYGGGVMIASLVCAILLIPVSPRSTIAIPQIGQIIDTLRRHDLRHGYAGYWESTIVMALADRQISSLALHDGDDRRLHTLNWFCNLDWFRRAARDWHGRTFFIVATEPGGLELSQDVVTGQFGRPVETIPLGQFMIDVYDFSGHELRALAPEGDAVASAPDPLKAN